MLYFAYGSNLDPEQMKSRCPESQVVGLASLDDYRVTFPRFSNDWGGGTASIHLAHGKKVWGVLYELSDGDLQKLDEYEGYVGPQDQHNVHDREHVTVGLERPDDGSIPRRVRAWTYIARPAHAAPPSEKYKAAMMTGATHHRLPEEYVAMLRELETAPARQMSD
jgi:gamma-glutamylcyclotransferase (GGCT)/AIG2-like uncharacterized protein YtfP